MFLYVISLLIEGILHQQLARIPRFLIPDGQPQRRCSKKQSQSLSGLTTQMLILCSHSVFNTGCQEISFIIIAPGKNGVRRYIFTCASV